MSLLDPNDPREEVKEVKEAEAGVEVPTESKEVNDASPPTRKIDHKPFK